MSRWYAEGLEKSEEGDHYAALVSLTKAMNCAIRLDDAVSVSYIERQISREYELVDDAATATTLLVQAQLELEKARSSAVRTQMGALLLLIVAILSTLVMYLLARKNQTERLREEEHTENERLMSIAEDLQRRLEKKRPAEGFDTLDRLCEQYYIYEGTENLQPKILREVKSIVEGLRSDPKVLKTLEKNLDSENNNLMQRLRSAFPKWKEEDFLLYLYTASGFSSTTVSTLLERDKQYVYNRLYRRKGRISALESPEKEEFLTPLQK